MTDSTTLQQAKQVKQGKQVNLGCGHIQPEGWINVDGSNRAYLASRLWWLDSLLVKAGVFGPTEFGRHTTTFDICKRFPWSDATIDAIYAGELFEHFTPEQLKGVLKECVRVLKPEGILRACVPDIHLQWKHYIAEVDRISQLPEDQWDDAPIRRHVKMFFDDICIKRPLLGSMGHFHKWGYDQVQLIQEFKRAGFAHVSRRNYLESDIQRIEDVETREKDFLIVEGVKPAAMSS